MRLVFSGADHEVTGSKHYLEIAGRHILVDCGMEQGRDLFENQEIPVPPTEIDYVFITHAHIDHSGLLPLIYAQGFKGSIYATEATVDLCDIMLKDSAHIQEFEAEWRNRKGKRAGYAPIVPLYTTEDAIGVMKHFVPCRYGEIIQICDGVKIRFTDAGHLLGSASIEIWAEENGESRKLVFSGDIGNVNQPIIRDPQYLKDADYVVMESTYGDRSHGPRPDYIHELADIIQKTFDRGGNLVIPSFAVGRTQEMLYFIRYIKEQNLIRNHDNFEVYVDSPLAVEATTIFNMNVTDCFDEEAMALINKGINPISFPGLKTSVTSEDSIAINTNPAPKVIISASGMCEAGRIRHHLKHNLWRPECTILFVGYQAEGTLGRSLVEGAKEVRLFGEDIAVKAEIRTLAGISGHADCDGLMKWISAFEKKPKEVFVVHGEDQVTETFAKRVSDELGVRAEAPYTGWAFDLLAGQWTAQPQPVRIAPKARQRRANSIFERLQMAGRRLLQVIAHNEGGTNRDLTKFTNEINNLCDKWDR
ncbi:MAG: MBL fold metallo-hydrolase RNA specificity domain-containing protein [Lachnospiraceae bacterium]|jgi:metallo-beta-lactamase family protein